MKNMKNLYFIFLFTVILSSTQLFSQSVGFSYFFPKYGYFSNPIAPLNFSLPLKMGDYFQITPGIGVNNIGGMSMIGFPAEYDSERALVGSFQTIEISLVPTIVIPMGAVALNLMGGVYGFYTLNCKILDGNFNNMLAAAKNYRAFDSSVSIDKSLFGWGYLFGSKIIFKVTKSASGYIGANYYMGSQKMALSGSFTGVDNSNNVMDGSFNFDNTALYYHGIQISVGAILK